MGAMASQITSPTIVFSIVHSGANQRKKSKLCVTGLCVGNSPVTGDFPAQMASNAEMFPSTQMAHASGSQELTILIYCALPIAHYALHNERCWIIYVEVFCGSN